MRNSVVTKENIVATKVEKEHNKVEELKAKIFVTIIENYVET